MYTRVIPRDLFNESKLLKCIGQVCLKIHDNAIKGLSFESDGEPFQIEQDEMTGNLSIHNIDFYVKGEQVFLVSSYNSKGAYPLYLLTSDDEEIEVFYEDGDFTDEFLVAIGDEEE